MNLLRPDQVDMTKMSVLDVRMRPGSKQIRGAVHYEPKRILQADPLVLPLDKEEPVVIYGDSEPVVIAVIDKLRRSGYEGAVGLEGGIEAWRDAGLPLEDSSVDQPVPGT
jgi:rhodanese-related sulfurtransferase